jgi:surface antigen
MVGRAGSVVGGIVLSRLPRAAAMLVIGALALIGGSAHTLAQAGLPVPPSARRASRPLRRLPVPPAFHAIVHRVAQRWHPERRPPADVAPQRPVHAVVRSRWHPVAHVVRRSGRLERAERIVHPAVRRAIWHPRRWHPVASVVRMSCVPFARADSGIDLSGDAYAWWDHAAGVYARGDVPLPGSVLAFRANVRMRLGHVAVVSRVINRREVEVDQANWGNGGRITRGVRVIDVSEENDWTDVRVALDDGRFGSVYPTYGFIYDRPDTGTMLARRAPAPEIAANPAPSDLRALHPFDRHEVAELPGRLPSPPHWPAHLTHRLHTRFEHREARHMAYRHPVTRHWAPHHAAVHHVMLHHVAMRRPSVRGQLN